MDIDGRAADDLEHVAGRGLVFERFLEVAGAVLQFASSRASDRDDRLVGEGSHQFDLPVGEPLDLFRERPIVPITAPSRSSGTPRIVRTPGRYSLGRRVVRVGEDVRDMHDLAFERRPRDDGAATGDHGSLAQDRPMLGVAAVYDDDT